VIAVRATPLGATLRVRVAPGAARERIVGPHGEALKVSVREPPEKGKANAAVERLLADAFGARPGDVAVVRGLASRDKVVLFRGWSEARLRERLDGPPLW
jgi:uncharacterized protein (TIGR00251 family)